MLIGSSRIESGVKRAIEKIICFQFIDLQVNYGGAYQRYALSPQCHD